MPRLTELSHLMFPVGECPVSAHLWTTSGERLLLANTKKAIVNLRDNRVLGIVGRGYRLVSNTEALNMAYQCCQAVFPETKPAEWGPQSMDAPASGGHCFIDLMHNSTALDFSFVPAADRPDHFGPFIRVTNSYNALRALSFDIGYYRKVCKNGLIVPDTIIRFAFVHSRHDIGDKISFKIDRERLSAFKTGFMRDLAALRDCAVAREQFAPMICGVLRLHPPQSSDPESPEAEDWRELQRSLSAMSDRYTAELGMNAYAVFNVITEFASSPHESRHMHRERHGFQRLAGAWITSFATARRKPDFQLEQYLATLTGGSEHAPGS